MDQLFPGSVTSPKGFQAAGVRCGLKEKGLDLALVHSRFPATAAALFTSNRIQAAPVLLSKKHIRSGRARALVINSGNANACTGEQGDRDATETAMLIAESLSLHQEEVLVASTGVIGKPLAMDKIRDGIRRAVTRLGEDGGEQAAQAIMTTDLVAKHFAIEFELDGRVARIGAMAKGSGMINPNLATLLCCITTDVAITSPLLDHSLRLAAEDSLNSLTVDGEMSTNDCALILANGQCLNRVIETAKADFSVFTEALQKVLQALARAIALDGEGASKLLLVRIERAADPQQAKRAAKAVANSLLVKTAVFGRDPNWGRVVSAVGGSGVEAQLKKMAVLFAGISVLQDGEAVPYSEGAMKAALNQKEIVVTVDLGAGDARCQVYSCDLSYDYIKINAEYHT